MKVFQVTIETSIPVEELDRESDRVGNNFWHSESESGHIYIESKDGGEIPMFLLNIWLDCIYHREIHLQNLEERE